MTKLSKELISQIAEEMVVEVKNEKAKQEDALNTFFKEKAMELIPKDVIEFWVKHPEYTRTSDCHYCNFKNDKFFYFHSEIPVMEGYDKSIVKECLAKNAEEFEKRFASYEELKKYEIQLRNKIMCNLSKLNTYKRVKDNFPEAHAILCKIMDTPVEVNLNLCDSVENLRAELNSIPKL